MRFPDPFDDEGLMFDFDDPLTRWITLALLLLAWLLICPFAGAQKGNDNPQVGAYVYYSGSPLAGKYKITSVHPFIYDHDGKYLLPNKKLTPGAINPQIVADPSGDHRLVDGVEVNICAKGFSTRPFRRTTEAMKRKVCEEYGSPEDCPDPKKGEIDHSCPLELGGEDTIENLWWQPAPQYHLKDWQVEDKLPKLVCSGKVSLDQAQSCITKNWVECWRKIQSLEKKK